MDALMLIGFGALLGLVGIAVSADLARAAKARARLVPVRVRSTDRNGRPQR